jgi:farnesyl diphosphate synthase
VADDIMDGSELRRGRPCWYKRDKVGLSAINDAFFLENFIYFTLKKFLKETPFYMELVETFHEFTLYTLIGQSLDTRTSLEGNPDR